MTDEKRIITIDGFADEADSDRLLQGSRLICIDGIWTWSKDGTEVAAGKRFLVLGTAEGQQHWSDGHLVEEIKKTPGEPFAKSVKERNAEIPEDTWEDGIGGPRAPWVHQFVAYLLDSDDGAIYTYMNSTNGAEIAIRELRNKVKWTRAIRGESVLPVTTLGSRLVSRQYKKMGPDFVIVEWRNLNPELPSAQSAALSAPQAEQLPGVKVEEPSLAEYMQDEIPPFDDPLPELLGGSPMPAPKPTAPQRKPAAQSQTTKRGVQKIAGNRR